jgi:phosphoserine phosphatase RsbU/P
MEFETSNTGVLVDLLEGAGVPALFLDDLGQVLASTSHLRRLLGWGSRSHIGESIRTLTDMDFEAWVSVAKSASQGVCFRISLLSGEDLASRIPLRAEIRRQRLSDTQSGWLLQVHADPETLTSAAEEEELRQGLAIIENAALILGWNGDISHVNPATTAIFGYPADELLGRGIGFLFDGEDQTVQGRIFTQALCTGNFEVCADPVELFGRDREGQRIPLELRTAVLTGGGVCRTLVVLKDLRRRKLAQEQLALLSSAVEQAPAGIVIADLKGVVEYANDGFAKLTGYSSEAVIGRNLLSSGSVVTAFSRSNALCWQILSNRYWQGEIRGMNRWGEGYAALVTFSPILGGSGDAIRLLGRFQDTTERLRDQEALAESEERFSEVAKLVGEWLWEQDDSGFFTYSSEAVTDILGYAPEELIGKHYQELMTEADRALWSNALFSVSRNQQPFHRLINHYRHRDGHEVFTESSGTPIRNEEGKVIRWRGVDRDITARKMAEDVIRLRERAIEAASVGIAIADARDGDYPIIYANSALSRISGYAPEELLGSNLRLLQGRGTDEQDREAIRAAIKAGRHCEVIIRNYRKDGQAFWNELQLSPVRDDEGAVTHFIGVITDVTERLRSEAQRHQLTVAREIQMSLLPKRPIVLPDIEAAGTCIAATQVGGDYYDIIVHGDYIDVVIADVSGHSVGPALIMAEMRSTLKAELRRSDPSTQSVGELLGVLNTLLFPDLDGAELFITMFYMRYERSTGILRFASAGHNPPLLLRRGEGGCRLLDADGLIIGVSQDVRFEEKVIPLLAGDRILLYTDGAVEAQDRQGSFFGMPALEHEFVRLRERNPEAILENLLDRLREFVGDTQFDDDVTMAALMIRDDATLGPNSSLR